VKNSTSPTSWKENLVPPLPIDLPMGRLAAFCRRWKIARLELFGSALREDFAPDSDLDFLVTFAPDAAWSLFDHFHMENELVQLLGRDVDVVDRDAVAESRNWLRRQEIFSTARTVYAA